MKRFEDIDLEDLVDRLDEFDYGDVDDKGNEIDEGFDFSKATPEELKGYRERHPYFDMQLQIDEEYGTEIGTLVSFMHTRLRCPDPKQASRLMAYLDKAIKEMERDYRMKQMNLTVVRGTAEKE
jgi:hypothetical protein